MKFDTRKILFILCGVCAFVLGMKQLREPDIWWQLAAGRWMLEHGAITHTDMFSYTMTGHPWINVKWLYEVLIAGMEKIFGPECVLLLQSLVNVTIVYLLIRTIKYYTQRTKEQISSFAIALSVLLFLVVSEYRMAGRPEMISHLLCTLYLFLLWRDPEMNLKKIGWLIPLQCLWANMHEGYPVGIVIAGTAVAGSLGSYLITKEKTTLQQAIRMLVVFAACVLIILANPNGIQLWKQPFEIYRQVWANKYTTELFSYKDAEYWTIQAKIHAGMVVLVFLYWIVRVLAAVRAKQQKAFFTPLITTYLILLPLFTYLSLTANRNIPFAQIVMLLSVAAALVWLLQVSGLSKAGIYQKLSPNAAYIGIGLVVIFYVSIVSDKFYKLTDSPNRYGIHVSMLHNPTGAANFIKEHDIKGTSFSDYFVSSYMLWDRYPDFKSYIDLRDLDVFPVSFFDDYFSMYNRVEKFDSLDHIYNFNYVLLSTSQLANLQYKLYWKEGYNMIYVDPVSVLFLKSNVANKPLNDNISIQKIFSWPPAIDDPAWAGLLTKALNPFVSYAQEDGSLQAIYAARFYNQVKNYPEAVHQLQPQMSLLEDNAEANRTMGNTLLQFSNALPPGAEKNRKMDSANIYLQRAEELGGVE
ncbi:MAG: hypothetical protein BGO70_01510 [Bacteroidetes bacterium 43-93]|nr:hypothetical protein [Bacteroidota bacterium]OJW96385.1 MAG: hypothetical protein BGO70_01510 [Bacteroidetes bacterium 43-93]